VVAAKAISASWLRRRKNVAAGGGRSGGVKGVALAPAAYSAYAKKEKGGAVWKTAGGRIWRGFGCYQALFGRAAVWASRSVRIALPAGRKRGGVIETEQQYRQSAIKRDARYG